MLQVKVKLLKDQIFYVNTILNFINVMWYIFQC